MNEHDEIADGEIADAELADRVREGDDEAYAVLWRRHSRAGLAAARPFATLADPDDLVSEAYLAILRALRGGGGPREAFRPYLYRTIRNLAVSRARTEQPVSLEVAGELSDDGDLEASTVEKTLTVRAFRTLPQRWQTVLWYSEVERMQPAEIAPLLGVAPNAAAALAHRAREGLRKAWLQAHVSDLRVPDGCRWTVDRMGDYARGGLTAPARLRFDRHLDGCARCSILLEEVDEVGRHLAVVLLPLVLGAGAALALLREPAGGLAAAATGAPAIAAAHSAARRPAVVGGALVGAAALVVAAVGLGGGWTSPDAPPSAAEAPASGPTEAPPTAAPETPTPAPTPAAPDDDPRAAAPPVTQAPPPPPPPDITAPPPVRLDGPGPDSAGNDPSPEFHGLGEAGAVVAVALTADGIEVVATSVVRDDGSWSLRPAALPDGVYDVRVIQTDAAGNRSAPVSALLTVDTIALPPDTSLTSGTYVALPTVEGTAESGATIELLVDGVLMALTQAAADGTWSMELGDPAVDSTQVTVRQTDRAGNVSAPAEARSLVLERPVILSPSAGAAVPSTAGSTSVEVEFDGVAGRSVEVVVDGIPTGNIHLLTGSSLVRVTAPLADGAHVIGFRYLEAGRPGATIEVPFTIAP